MRRHTVVVVAVLVLAALVATATLPAVSVAEPTNGASSVPANGASSSSTNGTSSIPANGASSTSTNGSLQTGSDLGGSDARIVELYPNPVAAGNRGEYLVVRLPGRGNWSLDDGYHDAGIPANVSGEVVLAMDPANASTHVDDDVDVHELDDYFPLAATGDRIELRRDGRVVDVVEYGRVRDGYRWRAAWGEWRPDGYEPRSAERAAGATVTPFVLPDSPGAPIEAVSGAEERLLLAGYTLESARVVDALVAAADRGVTVRVLIEGTPVGGFSERGASVGDRLNAAGVDVRVLDGDPDRFRFHHAKYAVADDRAVVLTENWKASGTGGRSNRGWGVVATDERVADDLATLFENDAAAGDTREWAAFRRDAAVYPSGTANDTYPARFEPPPATTADVTLLTAPGNAADRLVARIDDADDRALAIVPRTGGPDDRVVHALRRAADRGVDARLLLSGAWYDRDRNRELAGSLADEPIDVAVAEPRGRFGKVHAKGAVVDDAVVVGSLNYNEVARTENREVLLAIESAAVADFYARAYAADWRGGGRQLPVGLLGGFGVALVAGLAVARREVTFV